MATVSPQAATVAGTTLTMSAASGGGDLINMDASAGGVWVLIQTAGTSTIATFTTPGTVAGLAIADSAVSVATTTSKWVWLPYATFANSSGQCAVAWSATTSVTFAVLR
jgi:hypothetical protein